MATAEFSKFAGILSAARSQHHLLRFEIYTTISFIHLSIGRHLGCFHVLAIVNNATVNIGIHVTFSIIVFSGFMPSSGIVGSYGNFIPSF